LDAAASAFLRRRLLHQRLRAAAVRGLKAVSAGAGGRLQMNFDHAADWLFSNRGTKNDTRFNLKAFQCCGSGLCAPPRFLG